eukprot:6171973-Pleurochrysis_carterae.AAC.1
MGVRAVGETRCSPGANPHGARSKPPRASPSQLVSFFGLRCSLPRYVSSLEEALIETAATFGLQASLGRAAFAVCEERSVARAGDDGETGVWVEDRKLAAIGVSVLHAHAAPQPALHVRASLRRKGVFCSRLCYKPSVKRWVTSHGIALNSNVDLNYFNMIVPLSCA